ncbi:ATP-binding protein [Streptomyces ochraceiscleroticus]|uniref:ATP-binding protein n=1 Tax=Streptomyces ochraceiscleroticus TaxID=47761 RepID=A0ABW1MHL2_9ACTN|nr:hypothetical protein [Streptomyces ochraceiscleroticus]
MGNLPAQATRTVGREPELAQLRRLVARARLVTVTGVGGVGKTRLALQAAADLQPWFRDGAWLVELSPLRKGSVLPFAIAEALSVADQALCPMIDVVADHLAGREVLLILDTCEHLPEACALVAETLLRAAPGLRIVATSRRPLDMMVEEVFTLEPLPVPKAGAPAPGEDAGDAGDAVALLADRAAAAVPGFAVTEANWPQAAALCRRLEGLPLAIELAAARLGELPLTELTRRLEDRFTVLKTTEEPTHEADAPASSRLPSIREVPPWHRALRTAIGWSHQLCTPAERLLWARLSVFAGSFDPAVAMQVCADEHLPAEQIPKLLGKLVHESLLIWQPTAAGERYRMLDTIREYGAHWLRLLGERRRLHRRHRDFYLALARAGDTAWFGPDEFAWFDRVCSEHDNLRAALEFCLTEPEGHTALDLAGALWFLWYPCGFLKEGQHYLERALALDTAPSRARNKALWACALTALLQGDTCTGTALAQECTAVAEQLGDSDALTLALVTTHSAAWIRGDLDEVVSTMESLRPHRRPGELTLATQCVHVGLAKVQAARGRFEDAVAELEELRALCARRGERWARATADWHQARIELARGNPQAAHACARTSLEVNHRLHDRPGVAICLDLLARAAAARGHAERAAHLLGLAQQVWDILGRIQFGVPEHIAVRHACEQQLRHALGNHAFETAFRTGYETDPDTGIAHILSTPSASRPGTSQDLPGWD